MDNGLGKNDPYRNMDSAQKNIRPELPGHPADTRSAASNGAAAFLSSAETGAAQSPSQSEGGLDSVRQNEQGVSTPVLRNFYTGSGKPSDTGKKGKGKAFLKKRGPIVAICGLIVSVMGLMGGSQTLMPVAIEEMILEKFNSVGVSSTMSSDNLLDLQLNYGVLTHSEKRNEVVNGQQVNLFAFSEHQVNQFQVHGIQVVDGLSCNGQKVSALLYQKSGNYNAVVGSDCLGKISNAEIVDAAGIPGLEIAEQLSAKDALNDTAFKTPYTTASKSWRGGSSGWFDQIMKNITEAKLSINRNRWAKYVSKSIKSITSEFKEIASSSLMKSATTSAGESIVPEDVTVGEGEDAHTETRYTTGNSDNTYQIDNDDGSSSTANFDAGELSKNSTLAQINSVLNSKAMKAASAASEAACAILDGVMTIYTIVSAYQNLQFLNLVSGYLEAVDKMKAGDGDGSPIHEYSINLTTPGATRDNDGNIVKGKESTSAMESAGMAWLFGKNPISKNDPSVQNVNFESIMDNLSTITGNMELTASVYEKCGYVKAAVAAIDLASTVVSFVPIIGQGIKAIHITAKGIAKAAIKVAVTAAFYIIIPIASRKVAQLLIKDAATEWFGEDLGNALVSGGSKFLGGNGTSGGQSPGSRSKVISYMNAQNAVIAEEAEYQRSIRSPFDPTSRYTFLGSLAYMAIPYAYSSKGVMSVVNGVLGIVSNSLTAMLPTANAIDEASVLSSSGECGLLSTVGAQGDAFCNPYIITDTSTMNYAADKINELAHHLGENSTQVASLKDTVNSLGNGDNFEDDGVTIRKGSRLANYVRYCGQRTSQYGLRDAQIASELSGENSTTAKILGNVPLVNNVVDIVTGLSDEVNLAWATGEACVASDENEVWDTEMKYYQRYAENERLLENIDPDYTSPVTAYLTNYYDEHPLDQSLEGVLARFSGTTKEQVSDTLALIDYYNYIAQYDPSTRYQMGEESPEPQPLDFGGQTIGQNDGFIVYDATLWDSRQRNYAVA